MFSHRIHRIHRIDWQRCSPTEFTEFIEQTGRDVLPQNSRNRLAEDVLPQISQIYTDGACLEFCEFCVFCGTSHAPSESVKICAICGRIVLVAWSLPSYRIDWQRVSSHGIHRIHRSFACVFFPRNSQNSQKFRLRVLPTEFTEFTEVSLACSSHGIHRIHRSFACVFFPRNSQNSQKFRLRVLPTEFTEFTEVSLACSSHGIHRIHRSFACVFFPQNSQNSQMVCVWSSVNSVDSVGDLLCQSVL